MADIVLYNAVIHTLNAQQPRASAISIDGGQVRACGGDDAMRALLKRGGHALDLQGRCVVPGLIDAHVHFEGFALGLSAVDAETASLDELLERVRTRAQQTPIDQWILGWGWNHNAWDGQWPHKSQLDRVAPDHPIFLRAKSGHAGWANSRALALAGVDRSTPDLAGGQIARDGSGEATGILLEGAQALIPAPEPSVEEAARAIHLAQQQALARGLTGVHDVDGTRAFAAWQLLRAREHMQLRVCKSIPSSKLDEALAVGLRSGLGDTWLRLGGIKYFSDGALGPRTAWMLNPFAGEPDNVGMALMDMDQLRDDVLRASAGGLSCWIHAIGDRANREVLDALDAVRGDGLRHRIEHAQLLHADDLPRFAEQGVIASVQPIHATSDMHIVERFWGQRGRLAYAFNSLLSSGAAVAFGSDNPVEPIDPLWGIHAAVTRRRADGSPHEEGFYPQERLTPLEALHGYALGAAYASGEEALKGSLAPGKLADLVVLDGDLCAIDPMQLRDLHVLGTMVGGIWRYRAEHFDTGE